MVQNKTVRRMRGKARQRPKEEWIVVPGTHEAIIEPGTWDRVQELLRQRTRAIDFEKNVSIFAGFLKCADCGRAMVKRRYPDKDGKKKVSYTCGAYSRSGTEVCSSHLIRHEILERIVLDDLNTVLHSVKDLKHMTEHLRKEPPDYENQQEKETRVIQERLQKLGRLKKEGYSDYKEELLSKKEYLELRADYLRQENFLKEKLEKLVHKEAEKSVEMLHSSWIRNLLTFRKLEVLDRNAVVEFVEKIEIGEKNEADQQGITVHYRFSDELQDLFQRVYMDGI